MWCGAYSLPARSTISGKRYKYLSRSVAEADKMISAAVFAAGKSGTSAEEIILSASAFCNTEFARTAVYCRYGPESPSNEIDFSKSKMIEKSDPDSPYKIALTAAVYNVLKSGLRLLGIKVPEKM